MLKLKAGLLKDKHRKTEGTPTDPGSVSVFQKPNRDNVPSSATIKSYPSLFLPKVSPVVQPRGYLGI